MSDDLFASDLERRVVAHLPVYRSDTAWKKAEKAMREAGGYDSDWKAPKSLTIAELRNRILEDAFAPNPSENELQAVVAAVIEKGYVREAGDALAMTADGLDALNA